MSLAVLKWCIFKIKNVVHSLNPKAHSFFFKQTAEDGLELESWLFNWTYIIQYN